MNKENEKAKIINPAKERKIGNTTFIVSTAFNNGKERDVSKIILRLIQSELTA